MSRRKRKRRTKGRGRARRGQGVPWAWALGALGLAFGGLLVWAVVQALTATPVFLPPTDVVGHIESVPPDHILDEPMSIPVQKHMLEHADGNGPPGVVINYNCQDYECEPDMVERLADIVRDYPDFVYLAPLPNMTAKLAITRVGAIETFDTFDENTEAAIRAFIERRR